MKKCVLFVVLAVFLALTACSKDVGTSDDHGQESKHTAQSQTEKESEDEDLKETAPIEEPKPVSQSEAKEEVSLSDPVHEMDKKSESGKETQNRAEENVPEPKQPAAGNGQATPEPKQPEPPKPTEPPAEPKQEETPVSAVEPESPKTIYDSTVTFNNKLKRGSLEVIKSSEDDFVEGVTFHLFGTSLAGLPVDEYAITDASGVAKFENVLISGNEPYTVEEVDTAIRYVVPDDQTAPIQWKQVTKRNFENILKKFRVEVVKTDHVTGYAQGDASLAGAVYGLYQGDELIASYTTDANGSFISDYFICDSNWTLREISPSPGYLLDETIYPIPAEPGNFTVELNQIPMDVTEQVIMGRIRLIKHIDSELEDPESTPAAREQEAGMVMLAAVSVDDQPEEDVDGADVQTEETVSGNDAQTETENTEPEVSDEEAQEPEESGTEESAVPETEPETNPYEPDPVPMDEIEASGHEGIIEQPEKGAKFQIYLASAGSFESAREAERDELITDADGFAISKDLPYGRYVVHQTEGMEGQAFIPDFTVFIRSDEQTYSYILNNLTQSSFIRVEKHDAETGKIIPAAGVGFQVRDLSTGEIISQTVYYPTPVTIDTFFTNDEGWLMLPCELSYGQYELIEQETCFGYVLDSEPVPFTVDGTQDVVVVEKHNMPQKGMVF